MQQTVESNQAQQGDSSIFYNHDEPFEPFDPFGISSPAPQTMQVQQVQEIVQSNQAQEATSTVDTSNPFLDLIMNERSAEVGLPEGE